MQARAWLALVLLFGLGAAAQGPDLGPVGEAADRVVGDAAGAAGSDVLPRVYNATGQNVTREDVRLFLDLNFSKGELDVAGLLVGSGRAEVEASIHLRAELRVISSDRVRAAMQGENAYNVSADNATAMSDVYLTSEMFRATLSAETIARFQRQQEAALEEYLRRSLPEVTVESVNIAWSNTTPLLVARDTSLTEPPLAVELDAKLSYIRTESLGTLVGGYLDAKAKPRDGKAAYVKALKDESGDPLHSRDFFAAAAYTQLLNLSMQPGWSLDVTLRVPRGYSFTYFNENVELLDERTARFSVDALEADADVHTVVLASITHKRAVALGLFLATVGVGLLLALPGRIFYARRRLPRLAGQAKA